MVSSFFSKFFSSKDDETNWMLPFRGFKDRPMELKRKDGTDFSLFARFLFRIITPLSLNPLSSIRFLGPWGPSLFSRIRSDIIARFEPYVKDARNNVANYLYQCNAKNPS